MTIGDLGYGTSSYRCAPSDIERNEEGEYIGFAYRGSELCIAEMGGVHTYITTEQTGLSVLTIVRIVTVHHEI